MSQPNLLFLMSDQQRADTIESATLCQTPHLDSLATQGTRFARCYAPNPICSPTRASLMTGLLPHSHGMVDCTHTVDTYRARLKDDLPFWSRTLQAAGYRTAYFGKWHIERSNQLENFGFDVYEVDDAGYRRYRRELGLAAQERTMQTQYAVRQKGYRDFLLYSVGDEPVEATHEYYLYSRGIEFLKQVAQEADDRPWALFISTKGPHDPYCVPQAYYKRYSPADIPRPASFADDLSDRPAIYRRIQQVWQRMEWPQFAQATACYYAFCSLIDDQVGRILETLADLEQEEETLVIYTSDHGDYMGAHRLMLKGVPAFEEAYRVPLLMAGPGVPAGRTVDEIVSLIDLAPTLVGLTTGDDFPCQGRSMLPLLQADTPDWTSEAYAECHGQRFFYTQRVVWQDHYKYVFNGFDEDELYDLAADPHEMNNLIHRTGQRRRIEDMAARMWEIIRETDDFNMHQAQYGMFRFAPVGPEFTRPEPWKGTTTNG